MLDAYRGGVRAALERWPLIAALWAIELGFGAIFAVASATWLSAALEGSLATRTLLQDLDADVLVDLWYHHREGLHMLIVLGVVLAGLHWLAWCWLYGVVVSALDDRPQSPWQRGIGLAPAMARVSVIALAVWALLSAAVIIAGWGLLYALRESPSALLPYQAGAGLAVVWALATVWAVAVHDHARLRLAANGGRALDAYRWALAFVARGRRGAFLLACLLQASALAVWAGYQVINRSVSPLDLVGLTGAVLWGQVFLLARCGIRVWFMAAQGRVQG
ncbi:MAG: hypothetical protein AB7V27_09005 [Candidatus Binatia bacterium]